MCAYVRVRVCAIRSWLVSNNMFLRCRAFGFPRVVCFVCCVLWVGGWVGMFACVFPF